MEITDLIKFLDDKDTRRGSWNMQLVDTSFDTMPSEFIDFAEKDLQSNFEHKYINALSNAKRALDCQADRLLKLFGYYKESQEKFWGFPKKLDMIKQFDIIAPRVLNKINKTRNLMEHQYIKPNAEQVEDFLDIASLFIASTDHYASNFMTSVDYINEDNSEYENYGEITFEYNNEISELKVSGIEFTAPRGNKAIEFVLKKVDSNYINILKRHIKKTEFR
jgi:hypothetical protein